MNMTMDELNFTAATLPVTLTTHAPEETEAVGAALAALVEGDRSLPRFIAMYGDLGVGKTAFVRGMASALGYEGRVTSPTFTVVNEYRAKGEAVLLHFDMYRMTSADELFGIGWYDYLDMGAVCAVEWAERVAEALPPDTVEITIEGSGEMQRRITVK